MIRFLLAIVLLFNASLAAAQSSLPVENETKPQFNIFNSPKPSTSNAAPQPNLNAPLAIGQKILQRKDQVWRWPNGYEEYYMLLALATSDKQWCDRLSLESQIRKPDARPGVQVIPWRNICLIEVARATNNPELCRFARPTIVDGLDGSEFDGKYCLQLVDGNSDNTSLKNHWLGFDLNKPNFLNAESILKTMGFVEDDLVSQEKRGLYQLTTKASWGEYLMRFIGADQYSAAFRKIPVNKEKFDFIVKRSAYLPDFSKKISPADRYLRYSGTSVKLPADCYENPTAEFTCRMLECLNVRDLLNCRLMTKSQEIMDLYALFMAKCTEKNPVAGGISDYCKASIEMPYKKIFEGAPETFLPYLNR